MSNESSNTSVGKAGMEVGMTTAKFFQHLFERNGSSSLEGAFDRDDNASKGSNPRQLSKGQRILRKLPKKVQQEIKRVVEDTAKDQETKEATSPLRKAASFDFRKGFAKGVNMAGTAEITLGELSQVFEDILKAQPDNEYLQGLYKGAIHHDRTEELKRLGKERISRENDRGR